MSLVRHGALKDQFFFDQEFFYFCDNIRVACVPQASKARTALLLLGNPTNMDVRGQCVVPSESANLDEAANPDKADDDPEPPILQPTMDFLRTKVITARVNKVSTLVVTWIPLMGGRPGQGAPLPLPVRPQAAVRPDRP